MGLQRGEGRRGKGNQVAPAARHLRGQQLPDEALHQRQQAVGRAVDARLRGGAAARRCHDCRAQDQTIRCADDLAQHELPGPYAPSRSTIPSRRYRREASAPVTRNGKTATTFGSTFAAAPRERDIRTPASATATIAAPAATSQARRSGARAPERATAPSTESRDSAAVRRPG